MHCGCTDTTPTPWPRRIAALIPRAIPLTTLALIPKCPACVAAYVVLFTGIGLSLSAATAMRWTVIALSSATLAYLLLHAARRVLTPALAVPTSNCSAQRWSA
jgi:hypothetical protein